MAQHGTGWRASLLFAVVVRGEVTVGVRVFRTVAVTIAAVLVAVVGVSSAAFARAPNPGFRTSPIVMRDGGAWMESVLPETFPVGDCLLTYGAVTLDRPVNGLTRFVWHYKMYTTHTNNFDQWHGTFRFRDPVGHIVWEWGPVHAARMYRTGPGNYVADDLEFTDLFFGIAPPPGHRFEDISYVEWQGEC
jgi:hypothetical protein